MTARAIGSSPMLAEKLIVMGFNPDVDFLVRDDGEGPFIAEWTSAQPQPTQEELDAAWTAHQEALAAEETRVRTYLDHPEFVDMVDRLRSATAQQIDSYVDNNVTNLASARTLLKRILLMLGMLLKDRV